MGNEAGPLPQVLPTPLPTPALPGLPVPVPTVVPTAADSTEQLQALVPNELLDRINKFAFGNAPGGAVPAPPARSRGPTPTAARPRSTRT